MDLKSLPIFSNSPPIILLTTHTWNGLQYFAHHLSRFLVASGFRVVFVEKTPQRWPNNLFLDFFNWFRKRKHQSTSDEFYKNMPHIVSPKWLPPSRFLGAINRILVKKDVSKINKLLNTTEHPIVIFFPPTYNTLNFILEIKPVATAYINNFNYNADNVMKDLLRSETELLSYCDALFGLNTFCANRLRLLDPTREIFQCPPGVDYELFHKAYRGDEIENCRSVYYFGGIGPHLDFEIFDALAEAGIRVVMDGEVDPSIKNKLNKKFEIRLPTPHNKLPELLRDADCLIIAYRSSEYMNGVFPAKFFECLATGKPLIVSGLPELKPYYDIIYDVESSGAKAVEVIKSLPFTETAERKIKRENVAKSADWSSRFLDFFLAFNEQNINNVNINLNRK
jgi:glycosyltransferase involved in cell wall biosynthesis